MPGSCFKVLGRLNPAKGLHIVQLKEIEPEITFVASPGLESSATGPKAQVE
ncbi:unnamed protein product, partial [Rotaria sp. Silwood2]